MLSAVAVLVVLLTPAVGLVALLLAGCGFQLRGSAMLPFNTLYVDAPSSSLFATQLRRTFAVPRQARRNRRHHLVWQMLAHRQRTRLE